MLDFDPRILGGALGGAVFVLVIAGAAVVRRARARRRDRILGRVRLVGEERRRDRLARTAERLAGPTAPVPPLLCDPAEMLDPKARRCTCGAKPEGVRSGDSVSRRYHRRDCPARRESVTFEEGDTADLTKLSPARRGESEGEYMSRLFKELDVEFEDPQDGTRLDCAFLDEVQRTYRTTKEPT